MGTINGRADSQCIQHVLKLGGCDRRSKNCEGDVKGKMHDPKRLNQGILPEEVATWQECWKHKTGKCDYNVNECKFKHGDGTAQLAWKKTQLVKQQGGEVPMGAKANMSNSRGAEEADGTLNWPAYSSTRSGKSPELNALFLGAVAEEVVEDEATEPLTHQ